MQAGNNSTSNSDNKIEAVNLEDQDAVWNAIQTNFQAIFDSPNPKMECRRYNYREFERLVYIMCERFKNGHLVYNGVQQMVKQHIDKMIPKLENMVNGEGNPIQVTLQVDQLWSIFAYQMKVAKFVEGGERIRSYGWRLFCTEILENQQIKSALLASRLVLNLENANAMEVNSSTDDDGMDVDDYYKESPLFNVDTIIEIMAFLSIWNLGQQCATASRQMAKLSDYVLNKRKRILRPIAIWNDDNKTTEPFATQLKKEIAPNILRDLFAIDTWYTHKAPESRICLPDTEPPEWLTGVELIYVMGDGMHDKTYRFLNALLNKFQNCQLVLNLGGFFAKLQETGQSLQFFQLFNERCFSLVQSNLTWQNPTTSFMAKWPLWAIFNNIFFPNCRKLALTHEVETNEASKWLMHPSTESRPRLLELRSIPTWYGFDERLLHYIKEDFFNPTGKRMFFDEFPNGPAISAWQQGEWQNGIGEQLRISSAGITRLPKDQSQMEFKDFYDFPAVQPKVVFK